VTRYMSDFGKVKSCNNDCGTLIYFDAQSTIGHPSPDRWGGGQSAYADHAEGGRGQRKLCFHYW
jgi:hypothetical protein